MMIKKKVTPFETYQTYLSIKNHFSSPKYDYFKYGGRSRAKITAFNKRKDKYWFEKTSRKYPDHEIVDFLVSNFVNTDNPSGLWIGEIINSGERNYSEWSRRQQSLGYIFREQVTELFNEFDLDNLFDCSNGHPIILKQYLGGHIDLETLVILNKVFEFRTKFDKKLTDPVWETVSLKLRKYDPFININVFQYKKVLREVVNE